MLQAQVKVTTQLDKSNYLIGDYIRVAITTEGDSSYLYAMPPAESLSGFDLISVGTMDTLHSPGKYSIRRNLIYSVYDSGAYYFPQVPVAFRKQHDTTTYFALADSVPFTVQTVAVDTTAAIKPIKDVKNVRVVNLTWLYITGGIILLVLAGIFIYYRFIKNRKKKIFAPVEKVIPLHESTLARLRALEEKKLWQQDELKAYYSELTEIIRDYMEQRLQIKALESTTDEIIDQLRRKGLAPQLIENILFILDTADMAKFAKSKPLPNENLRAMALAVDFVNATPPAEPKPEIKK